MRWRLTSEPSAPGVSAGAGAPTPTHLLFPYRPSRRGDRALLAAAELADENGARLTVLAPVVHQEKGRRCCGLQGQRWIELLRESAADDLTRAQRLLGASRQASFASAEGEDFNDVVREFAREHRCDLTVMAPSVAGGLADRYRQRPLHQGLRVEALPR